MQPPRANLINGAAAAAAAASTAAGGPISRGAGGKSNQKAVRQSVTPSPRRNRCRGLVHEGGRTRLPLATPTACPFLDFENAFLSLAFGTSRGAAAEEDAKCSV